MNFRDLTLSEKARAVVRVRSAVVLRASEDYEDRLPPEPVGRLLFHLPRAAFHAVRMRFEGRSSAAGRPPGWLSRAADIRVVDVSADDGAVIVFDAPQLGVAAEELYAQEQFWSTRPDPGLTALEVLGDVVDEVKRGDENSDLFDRNLLNSLRSLQGAISNGFNAIEISCRDDGRASTIDHEVINKAVELTRSTPEPMRVRVAGELDMIRASTGAFALLLDSGEELPAVRVEGDATDMGELLGQRVVVFGVAVFRPSGNVLRVEADTVAAAPDAATVWSEMPRPRDGRVERSEFTRPQGPRSGIAAVFGAWPGDESDEEIAELLEEIS